MNYASILFCDMLKSKSFALQKFVSFVKIRLILNLNGFWVLFKQNLSFEKDHNNKNNCNENHDK